MFAELRAADDLARAPFEGDEDALRTYLAGMCKLLREETKKDRRKATAAVKAAWATAMPDAGEYKEAEEFMRERDGLIEDIVTAYRTELERLIRRMGAFKTAA